MAKLSKKERDALGASIQQENEMLKRVVKVARNASIALAISLLLVFWGFTGMKDAFLPDISEGVRNVVKWIALITAVLSFIMLVFALVARHNGRKHVLKNIDRVIITGNGDSYAASLATREINSRMFPNKDYHVLRCVDVSRHYIFPTEHPERTLVIVISVSGGGARVTARVNLAEVSHGLVVVAFHIHQVAQVEHGSVAIFGIPGKLFEYLTRPCIVTHKHQGVSLTVEHLLAASVGECFRADFLIGLQRFGVGSAREIIVAYGCHHIAVARTLRIAAQKVFKEIKGLVVATVQCGHRHVVKRLLLLCGDGVQVSHLEQLVEATLIVLVVVHGHSACHVSGGAAAVDLRLGFNPG